ncbi:MAG: tRNA (adenosine(37)-N6)-threonylcarbamoyltransferase complex dimerization subunit type 1 TsaB [Candidatus Omnitrophota bacterium]
MKILGIDTTTKVLSIGAYDGVKIYEYNIELGVKQATLLAPIIKRILDALKWKIEDVNYFACGLGPGSFTGIRVGLATIKGFAWALDLPIAGVETLDLLASNAKEESGIIIPLVDAKRNMVYACIYQTSANGLKKKSPYLLITMDELIKKIKAAKYKAKLIFLGDAIPLYKEKLICELGEVSILDKDCWYPKGHNIIEQALIKIKSKKISNTFNIEPIYLYPKECQIRKH